MKSKLECQVKKSEIKKILPYVVQAGINEGTLYDELIGCMEDLHGSTEIFLTNAAGYLKPADWDANNCSEQRKIMLKYLASWFGFEWLMDFDTEETGDEKKNDNRSNLRNLIINAMWLHEYRGTEEGIKKIIKIVTGIDCKIGTKDLTCGDKHLSTGQFIMSISIQQSLSDRQLVLIERVIEYMKPAYMTYEIDCQEYSRQVAEND